MSSRLQIPAYIFGVPCTEPIRARDIVRNIVDPCGRWKAEVPEVLQEAKAMYTNLRSRSNEFESFRLSLKENLQRTTAELKESNTAASCKWINIFKEEISITQKLFSVFNYVHLLS